MECNCIPINPYTKMPLPFDNEIPDKKVIIVKDNFKKYITEEGIEVISLKEWLLGGE